MGKLTEKEIENLNDFLEKEDIKYRFYAPYELVEWFDDVYRLKQMFHKMGLDWRADDICAFWLWYSDSVCATWISIHDELVESIVKNLSKDDAPTGLGVK